MSQFGDGGLLGSKPYISSGAYINRMSDYCGNCRYNVKERIGDDACPFNALYWDFLIRHRDKLGGNRRLAMPYRNWDRQSDQDQHATLEQAAAFFRRLDFEGEESY
jgi:deoxyribodipyrimidine photolyase-related protein